MRACVRACGRACVLRACAAHAGVRAWELMGTYRNFVRGNLWEIMGILWELMGTYGNFVRRNLWELMGTYGNLLRGNLWELMGTLCGVAPSTE